MFLALLMSGAIAGSAFAQTNPDLSGTWTMDEKRSGSPGHDTFVGPVVWVIKQSPQTVVVDRKRGEKSLSHTYALADKKAPPPKADTTVESPPNPTPSQRAYWDGDRLVTETMTDIQGKTVTTREVLSLTGDGRELTVERVVEVEHGYTMKGAQNFNTVKDVFVRAAPQQ